MNTETANERIAREEAEWESRRQAADGERENRVRANRRNGLEGQLAQRRTLMADLQRQRDDQLAVIADLGPAPVHPHKEYQWRCAKENAEQRISEIDRGMPALGRFGIGRTTTGLIALRQQVAEIERELATLTS